MRAFDVDIDMDDVTMKHKINQAVVSFGNEANNTIVALDEEVGRYRPNLYVPATYSQTLQIVQAAQSIRNSHMKRQFLQSFAQDPAQFIHTWIASQARDLEVILGEGADGGGTRGVRDEDLRRSDYFRMPWVSEAVAVHEGTRVTSAFKPQGVAGGAGR